MEKVLIGGGCLLPLCLGASLPGRLGECVSDGGDEIGESWVAGGGVLPLKGLRPLDMLVCARVLCVLRGSSRLSGEELLL